MNKFALKRTPFNGMALALPLGIASYLFLCIFEIFEKKFAPFTCKIGIEHFLGELTLTILVLLLMLLPSFELGLLTRFIVIERFSRRAEDVLFKLIPIVNQFKMLYVEKLDIANATIAWKAALLRYEAECIPVYIIDESAHLADCLQSKDSIDCSG